MATKEPTLASTDDRSRIVTIARSWIGTPYVHQASIKGAGCDCLGLLRGVWRELRGAEPEDTPPYAPDWSEVSGEETLYMALSRHIAEVEKSSLQTGDVALFRMTRHGPAKHCGIVAERCGRRSLIHARQNKRVSEEALSTFWLGKLAFAFRM